MHSFWCGCPEFFWINSFFEALLNILPKQGDVHISKLSVNTVIAKAQAM
jgi:hypothetical protein